MKEAYSTSSPELNKIKTEYLNGYLIPYRKAIKEQQIIFQKELLNDITKNDIYELPIGLHMELIQKRWDDFVRNYVNKDKVVVFECCFIQNPVTVSMIKNNSSKDFIMSYITSLAKKIAPLEPVLIYVEQQDIKSSFNKAVSERPNDWFYGFTNYYTNQGYGLANNLIGVDGVVQVLEARSKLEKKIYDSLKISKYKIDNSAFNLDLTKERANSILEMHL